MNDKSILSFISLCSSNLDVHQLIGKSSAGNFIVWDVSSVGLFITAINNFRLNARMMSNVC